MQWPQTIRERCKGRRFPAALAIGCMLVAGVARAQVSDYGQKQLGAITYQQPTALQKIGIQQKLNTQIPLNGQFYDETGKQVRLGDYFGKTPVILSLVYYQCKLLCPEEITGLVDSLRMVKFTPGKDFQVVFVSIDPSETPQIAAKAKAFYLKTYDRPGTSSGWHFLTGEQPSINALASATGFSFVRVPGPDGKLTQFAHASSVELLTPSGKLSQYYLGVEYSPKDIQLGLVEAGEGKIGSPVDNLITYCYRYDPQLNRHSLIVARIVQAACILTVLILGTYMVVMFRRDWKQGRATTAKLANG